MMRCYEDGPSGAFVPLLVRPRPTDSAGLVSVDWYSG
jgi:hypothetical protein